MQVVEAKNVVLTLSDVLDAMRATKSVMCDHKYADPQHKDSVERTLAFLGAVLKVRVGVEVVES
jgi:hypothetical protein